MKVSIVLEGKIGKKPTSICNNFHQLLHIRQDIKDHSSIYNIDNSKFQWGNSCSRRSLSLSRP